MFLVCGSHMTSCLRDYHNRLSPQTVTLTWFYQLVEQSEKFALIQHQGSPQADRGSWPHTAGPTHPLVLWLKLTAS